MRADVHQTSEVSVADGVFYRESTALRPQQIDGLWPAEWRLLSRSPSGRSSLLVALELGAGIAGPGSYDSDIELFVHKGAIKLGAERLGYRDYARISAGQVVEGIVAQEPTELLFFSTGDPRWTPAADHADISSVHVVRYEVTPWKGGEVSRAAGEDIPLRIKHYRNDPITGARTFIVASGPDAVVPWERHSIVEEGFLIEGDYTLAECLDDGKRIGEYRTGGYFYRPPGIIHSGPESRTKNGAMWLIRTPAALDVEFLDQC